MCNEIADQNPWFYTVNIHFLAFCYSVSPTVKQDLKVFIANVHAWKQEFGVEFEF